LLIGLAKTGQQFLERFAGYSCHCPYQAVIVENAFQFQHLLSTLQLLVIIPYFPTGLILEMGFDTAKALTIKLKRG
jgi:hypothetical protein